MVTPLQRNVTAETENLVEELQLVKEMTAGLKPEKQYLLVKVETNLIRAGSLIHEASRVLMDEKW